MKITVAIDRLEGDKAIFLADDVQIVWPRQFLPKGAKESDLITIELDVDVAATLQAQAETAKLLADLVKIKPKGN
jgi:hypothetical protein